MSDAGEMRALGVSPNPRTFSVLLSAASRGGHGQQALEVFAEMEALGVRPVHLSLAVDLEGGVCALCETATHAQRNEADAAQLGSVQQPQGQQWP